MTQTLGIDPGGTGAIATLNTNGQLIDVRDMPYLDGMVMANALTGIILNGDGDRVAWVERAQAYPGQGRSSAFKYGTGFGVILGVLGALSIPYQLITPAVWKRKAGLSDDKAASRRRAIELWPSHAQAFNRVKDDGRAEAALIARYGWLLERQQVAG